MPASPHEDAVLALPLRVEAHLVGQRHQLLGFLAFLGKRGSTNADREKVFRQRGGVRGCPAPAGADSAEQVSSQPRRSLGLPGISRVVSRSGAEPNALFPNSLGERVRIRAAGLRKNYREFIAAEATDIVRETRAIAQHAPHLAQCGIPLDVAQAVIYPLEVVDIEDKKRQRALVPTRTVHLLGQNFVEIPAVEHARYFIDVHVAEDALELGLGNEPHLPKDQIADGKVIERRDAKGDTVAQRLRHSGLVFHDRAPQGFGFFGREAAIGEEVEELAVEIVAGSGQLRDDPLQGFRGIEVTVLTEDLDQIDPLVLKLLQLLEVAHTPHFIGRPVAFKGRQQGLRVSLAQVCLMLQKGLGSLSQSVAHPQVPRGSVACLQGIAC